MGLEQRVFPCAHLHKFFLGPEDLIHTYRVLACRLAFIAKGRDLYFHNHMEVLCETPMVVPSDHAFSRHGSFPLVNLWSNEWRR